jgi:hypothetical protein
MSTLKEDLTELSDVLPLLPAEVTALNQSALELVAASATLLAEVRAGREDLESLLAHVRDALPGFTSEVEILDQRLEGALDGMEKAWTEADDHLEEGEKALAAGGEQVNTEHADLLKALAEAGTKIDQASADGEAVIDRVEAAARDGQARIKTAADAVSAKAAALNAVLGSTTEAMTEASQAFQDRVSRFVENARVETDATLDHFEDGWKQYTQHLEVVAKEVEPRADAIVMEAGRRTADNVRQPLVAAAEAFRIALERLVKEAADQQEAVARARGEQRGALDRVVEALDPILTGIQQIDDAARHIRQQ